MTGHDTRTWGMAAFSLGDKGCVTGTVSRIPFKAGRLVQFKEPKARSQETQVPVLVLQLTTKCKYFISVSLDTLTHKMRKISLPLTGLFW